MPAFRWLSVWMGLVLAAPLPGWAGSGWELPRFEEARYSVSWGIIPAGKGMFRARAVEDGHVLRAQICSTGLVDAIHPVRDQLYSEVTPGDGPAAGVPRPVYHRLTQIEAGKRKETILEFLSGGRLRVEKHKKGRLKKEEMVEVPPGIHDPLSIIYEVRRLPLEVGETYRVPLYDQEVVTLVVPVLGRMELKGYDVLEVRPYVEKDGEPKEKGNWELFLTDDQRRIPVRMKLALSFGKLLLDMTDYRREGEVAHPARMFCDPEVTMPR